MLCTWIFVVLVRPAWTWFQQVLVLPLPFHVLLEYFNRSQWIDFQSVFQLSPVLMLMLRWKLRRMLQRRQLMKFLKPPLKSMHFKVFLSSPQNQLFLPISLMIHTHQLLMVFPLRFFWTRTTVPPLRSLYSTITNGCTLTTAQIYSHNLESSKIKTFQN